MSVTISQLNAARDKQAGRVLLRREGDLLHVNFPDRSKKALKVLLRKYQDKPGDGFGSHYRGKHKLG